MKYLIRLLFLLVAIVPYSAGAQFQNEFIVEAEVYGETVSNDDNTGGSRSSTRTERDVRGDYIPNVRDIAVRRSGETLIVTWVNPEVDFEYIRVVRSNFYAQDPYDGWVIHEGVGEVFHDDVPNEEGTYYTFFVIMPDGDRSSGIATFYADAPLALDPFPPSIPLPPDRENVDDVTESLPESATTTPPLAGGILGDIILSGTQDNIASLSLSNDAFTVFAADEDILFSVVAGSLPLQSNTVVLALENKITGTTERFLMRREAGSFNANVPRRLKAGEYKLFLGLYDINADLIGSTSYPLYIYPHYFVKDKLETKNEGKILVDDYIYVVYIITTILSILFLLRLFFVIKNRG